MRAKASAKVFVVPEGRANRIEVRLGDKAVSRLCIFDLEWRVGSASVRMGGIGGVATDSGHRNRGYSRLCMDRACAFMREEGYDMSALFGIGNFYPKWGFASAIAEPRLRISTRQAEESIRPSGLRVVSFNKARHAKAVLKIYELNNRFRSGSLVRPAAKAWSPFRMGSGWFVKADNFVVTDHRGRVLGYASHDRSDDSLVAVEVGCCDPRGYPAVTAELARRAVVRRASSLVFFLPPDHAFAEYLHRWDAEQEIGFSKWSSGMARMICIGSALRKCEAEFSRRIRRSGFGAAGFSLSLLTDLGSFTLRWQRGVVRVLAGRRSGSSVRLPQDVLAQLILGYRSVRDASAARGVRVSGRAMELLEVIFPKGLPYMCQTDRF